MPLKLSDAWWPLALATMAGLSTSVGAVIAVVRKPSAQAMAAMLGIALGVMATVSLVELVARNAMSGESDPLLVLAAAGAGALTYYILEPFFPKMDESHDHIKKHGDVDDHEAFFRQLQPHESHPHQHHSPDMERSNHGASQRKVVAAAAGHGQGGAGALGLGLLRKGSGAGDVGPPSVTLTSGASAESGSTSGRDAGGGSGHGGLGGGGLGADSDGGSMDGGGGSAGAVVGHHHGGGGGGGSGPAAQQRVKAARMLRLGVLMAVTMTLHNLPEGFAVAFSAFTDFGPVMALAIALHNIPEGVIVAAPIYAATGSRWRAVGIATASGLSEPLGALLSLLLLQPFFTLERLHYLLAFVGGVMLAVCGIELWPEGRNCRHDGALAAGIAGGAAVMGWTLYVGG